MTTYENELYHHGILGQKWGVRRYQNYDGTRTAAGKKRLAEGREEGPEKKKGLSKGAKTAIGVGAAGLAAAGLAAYALRDEYARNKLGTDLAVLAWKGDDLVKKAPGQIKKSAIKQLKDGTQKAGKAMTEAAMLSVGAIAVSELSKKFASNEDDSAKTKYRNKLLFDTTSAGVKAVTRK